MKRTKYLRNRKTGVTFPWNERMAGMDIMDPTNTPPTSDRRNRAMRQATFPLPKGDKPKQAPESAHAPAEPPSGDTQVLAENDALHEIVDLIKKERSKDGVIELAREHLGINIELKDDKDNDRKLVDLKNEAIAVVNSRLGHG